MEALHPKLAMGLWSLGLLIAIAFGWEAVTLQSQVAEDRDSVARNVGWLIALDRGDPMTPITEEMEAAGLGEIATPLRDASRPLEERKSEAIRALRVQNRQISIALGGYWDRTRVVTLGALGFAASTLLLGGLVVVGTRRREQLAAELERAALLEAANEKERALLDELKRSNAQLERFAVAISHDLHTPLRAVRGFGALLGAESDRLTPEGREYLQHVTGSADRMYAMLEGLLAVSRVGTRSSDPCVDVEGIVLGIEDDLRTSLLEAGASLELRPLPPVHGNPTEVARLFQNLLENALRYRSPERPLTIEVRATREDDHVHFVIADNGRGVPEGLSEKVFQMFRRGHHPDQTAGTGVGLSLCQRIVERDGGCIWIEDNGPGAAVHFTLPAATDQAAAASRAR